MLLPSKHLQSPDSQELQDSQATLVGSLGESSSTASTLSPVPSAVEAEMSTGEDRTNAAPTDMRHYVAAFRGREMHGQAVDLPDGYAGVVLRAPDNKIGKGMASSCRKKEEENPKSTGRTTRRSKRGQEAKVEDEADAPEFSETASDEGPTRVLEPVSTFSSFVLWNADIPANDGRDEYVRSLREWTKLAAVVSTGATFMLSPSAVCGVCCARRVVEETRWMDGRLVDRCGTACNSFFPYLFPFMYVILC